MTPPRRTFQRGHGQRVAKHETGDKAMDKKYLAYRGFRIPVPRDYCLPPCPTEDDLPEDVAKAWARLNELFDSFSRGDLLGNLDSVVRAAVDVDWQQGQLGWLLPVHAPHEVASLGVDIPAH